MKRWLKILAAVVVVAIVVLGVALSHDSACPATLSPGAAGGTTKMKAIVYRCYGPPEVLHLEDVEKPVPADDELLVRVLAASVNPLDWHFLRGVPYLMRMQAGFGRPKDPRLGVDFSGTVEAVGKNVTRFKPGDAVYGARGGTLAEYVTVRESRNVVPKPERLSFEQAAAVPVAAVTALQALRDHGKLMPGQKVLINGASGGVGTFAVQIAKALGAQVTGVCSTRNVEMVRALGADHVIDYTQQNFTQGTERYDLIVDNVSTQSFLKVKDVLEPDGRYVIVGSIDDGRWLGGLKAPLKAKMWSLFAKQKPIFFLARIEPEELAFLSELMTAGKVTPIVDRTYPLAQAGEAIGYLEQGHARGKVVVVVPGS